MAQIVTAAIIQSEPVYYNLPETLTKSLDLLHSAAHKGAKLITFGETWLPGYPVWLDICSDMGLWNHEPTKQVFQQLYENSPTLHGAEMQQLQAAAKQLGVVVVMGINERIANRAGYGTLYNTLVTIDANGEIVNHHRKLVPTFTERMVWGMGDGAGLQAVETAVGRVGGLVCWEHWMPLARHTLHQSAEQIHIAAWPTVKDMLQIASRHYAHEGRTFVLAAGSLLRAKAIPAQLSIAGTILPEDFVQRGGSAIIAPNGDYLAGPVFNEDVILTADLDLGMIIRENMALDVTGHYARPDVFSLHINRERKI